MFPAAWRVTSNRGASPAVSTWKTNVPSEMPLPEAAAGGNPVTGENGTKGVSAGCKARMYEGKVTRHGRLGVHGRLHQPTQVQLDNEGGKTSCTKPTLISDHGDEGREYFVSMDSEPRPATLRRIWFRGSIPLDEFGLVFRLVIVLD